MKVLSLKERFSMDWVIAVALAVLVFAAYWRLWDAGFTNYDDPYYVTQNPDVTAGLTWSGFENAWRDTHTGNWHPVTMLSHVLDCELFGLNPRGHHFTNVLIHAANTVLLFILVRALTGSRWRSGIVAALFGLHPMHVESVAWISERKDVLSGLFFFATLLAYGSYVRCKETLDGRKFEIRNSKLEANSKSQIQNQSDLANKGSSVVRVVLYVFTLLLYALGLMSKPMLVTTPFVMLLLDWWPIKRVQGPEPGRLKLLTADYGALILEKVPFFLLSAITCLITLVAQKAGGAMPTLQQMTIGARIANALHAYAAYVWKIVFPFRLAVLYPSVQVWPVGAIVLAAATLLAISVVVCRQRRMHPYLVVGWAWFVGTLVPVIGLVQVGNQAMADRYTYLPAIGLFLMIVWAAYDCTVAWPTFKIPAIVAVSLCLALCAWGTVIQTGYWKNSRTLFEHATEVTKNNFIAYNNLAFDYGAAGDMEAAKRCVEKALTINPASDVAWAKLGAIRAGQGDLDGAAEASAQALRLNPNSAEAHANFGMIYTKQSRAAEGIAEYQTAVRLKPRLGDAHFNLANALARQGNIAEALNEFGQAARWEPQSADVHNNYGFLLSGTGQFSQAADEFRKALALQPSLYQAKYGLGRALDRMGQHEEAVRLLSEVWRDHPELRPKGVPSDNPR
jgi:tetratricopeptide (TPR) repeat protein